MVPLSKVLNSEGRLNPEWVQYLNGPVPLPVTVSGSFTPNGTATNSFRITMTGPVAIQSPINVDPGTFVNFEFLGTAAVTFGSAYLFPGGAAPAYTGARNFSTFYYDGAFLFYIGGGPAGGGGITALTGDVTASGSGSVAATLATVNATPGTYANATVTVNAKGLVTLATAGAGGAAPNPWYNYTSCILPMDIASGSTAFIDQGPRPKTVTTAGGNVSASTVNPMFGTACASFTNVNSNIILANVLPDLDLATGGDWTIRFWVLPSIVIGVNRTLLSKSAFTSVYPFTIQITNAGFIHADGADNSGTTIYSITGSTTLSTSVYSHIALTCTGGRSPATNTYRLFLNGALQASAVTSAVTLATNTANVFVGAISNNTGGFTGLMDGFEIIRGWSAYPGAFTPPTGPTGLTAPF